MIKKYLSLASKVAVAEIIRGLVDILPDAPNGQHMCCYKDSSDTDANVAKYINEVSHITEEVSDWHVRSIRQQLFGRLRKPPKPKQEHLVNHHYQYDKDDVEALVKSAAEIHFHATGVRLQGFNNKLTEHQDRLTTLETIADPFRNAIYDIQKFMVELKTRENAIEEKIKKIVNGPTPWELK